MRSLPKLAPTEMAEAIAVVASVGMAAGMISVAAISGSVSVLAEGIDTCVDIVTSVAVMIGLRLSKHHSRDFPYGMYKVENIVTVAIAALILLSAYGLAREAIGNLLSSQETVHKPWVAMATMTVVAVVTSLLAWNKGRVGKSENSPSLRADARHSYTDAIASAGVVIGLGLNALGVPYVDSLMALAIAAILAWSGVQLLISAVKVLLDASLEQDIINLATAAAEADPYVKKVVRVDGRNSGSYRFLSMSVIPQSDYLSDAEACARSIKDAVHAAVANVEAVQIELVAETSASPVSTVAVLLSPDGTSVAASFDTAGSFVLLRIDRDTGAVSGGDLSLRPASGDGTAARAIDLAVTIARHGAEQVVLAGDFPAGGPYYVLDANRIVALSRPDLRNLTEVESAMSEILAAARVAGGQRS